MWLIGQEWKYSNVCSGLILIGRGLDLNYDLGKLGKSFCHEYCCSVLRAQIMQNSIVGVFCDEGTPVPIPNTVVKLIYADNTWLATAREDRSMPTQKRSEKIRSLRYSSIAQLVEHAAVNRRVVGSSPT